MAHFAQLNEQSIVTQVIVVNNDVIDNQPFPQSEPIGIAFCKSLYGPDTIWAQTSYNGNFRYNYAAIGYAFVEEAQPTGAFISPKPYPSWLLNTNIYQWEAPVPCPTDGKIYSWDEATQSWVSMPEFGVP
jgi:hypothetical protein